MKERVPKAFRAVLDHFPENLGLEPLPWREVRLLVDNLPDGNWIDDGDDFPRVKHIYNVFTFMFIENTSEVWSINEIYEKYLLAVPTDRKSPELKNSIVLLVSELQRKNLLEYDGECLDMKSKFTFNQDAKLLVDAFDFYAQLGEMAGVEPSVINSFRQDARALREQ